MVKALEGMRLKGDGQEDGLGEPLLSLGLRRPPQANKLPPSTPGNYTSANCNFPGLRMHLFGQRKLASDAWSQFQWRLGIAFCRVELHFALPHLQSAVLLPVSTPPLAPIITLYQARSRLRSTPYVLHFAALFSDVSTPEAVRPATCNSPTSLRSPQADSRTTIGAKHCHHLWL